MLLILVSDLGIGSVLLSCIESVLFSKSLMISGVLPRTSLACFVFVFSLSFESVSAMEPIAPEDLNETTVVFALLSLFLP